MALTVAAALAAEGIYFLAQHGVTTVLGSGSDPFQPSVIPFNVGAIACGYLAGVALVRPWRSRRTKAVVRSGSDNAYGIYLSQMLFITALTWLGWGRLSSAVPWPLLCLLTVGIVFACGIALTGAAGPDAAGGAAHRAQAAALVDADTAAPGPRPDFHAEPGSAGALPRRTRRPPATPPWRA